MDQRPGRRFPYFVERPVRAPSMWDSPGTWVQFAGKVYMASFFGSVVSRARREPSDGPFPGVFNDPHMVPISHQTIRKMRHAETFFRHPCRFSCAVHNRVNGRLADLAFQGAILQSHEVSLPGSSRQSRAGESGIAASQIRNGPPLIPATSGGMARRWGRCGPIPRRASSAWRAGGSSSATGRRSGRGSAR